MNQVVTINRCATRCCDGPFNVIVMPTHERYEVTLSKANCEFWAFRRLGAKDWDTRFAPVPNNYHLLNPNKGDYQIPVHIDIDLVLAQNRLAQYPKAQEIATRLGVPLLTLEHTLPTPDISESVVKQIRSMQGDIDVFVTDNNRKAWGFPDDHGEICPIGIDVDLFHRNTNIERTQTVLTVANDFINRDPLLGFTLWRQTTGYPEKLTFPVRIVGNTKGLSEPAQTTDDLVQHYNECAVYLNTTLVSSLPTVILEAMACEIPVVTTGTTLIPKLMVKHGYNGFVSATNDPNELRYYCDVLLKDNDTRKKMGANARKWVTENFSEKTCIDKWNEIFKKAVGLHR